jgi:hypothetical protein
MKLPSEIVDIISSFNGTQSELNCERGLRYMFLFNGKFFSWGLGNREETLPEFFALYQPNRVSIRDLVKCLLKNENWKEVEDYWATEFRVKNILSKVTINDKDCCNKNQLVNRQTSIQAS